MGQPTNAQNDDQHNLPPPPLPDDSEHEVRSSLDSRPDDEPPSKRMAIKEEGHTPDIHPTYTRHDEEADVVHSPSAAVRVFDEIRSRNLGAPEDDAMSVGGESYRSSASIAALSELISMHGIDIEPPTPADFPLCGRIHIEELNTPVFLRHVRGPPPRAGSLPARFSLKHFRPLEDAEREIMGGKRPYSVMLVEESVNASTDADKLTIELQKRSRVRASCSIYFIAPTFSLSLSLFPLMLIWGVSFM